MVSIFPFVVEVLFSIAFFHEVHWLSTFLFFIGTLVFGLATTAINNHIDYERAHSKIYKYEENVIGCRNLSPALIRSTIPAMIAPVFVIDVILTINTGWFLPLMGFICCFIGVSYTSRLIPLSRMPLGEIFNGMATGLGILAMVVYVDIFGPDVYDLTVNSSSGQFVLVGSLWATAAIVLASLLLMFTIVNIMLTNSLRDLDRDTENHHHIPIFHIGHPAGTVLSQLLMCACYFMILMGLLGGTYE